MENTKDKTKNKISDNNLHDNRRERMREKVLRGDLSGLHEHEILEILLYSFIPRKDTNPIAHQLIEKCGSLAGVFDSDYSILEKVPNMTRNAAIFLSMMPQVIYRYKLSQYGKKIDLSNYSNVKNYAIDLYAGAKEESIIMLTVDNGGRLINKCVIGKGTDRDCKVVVRELVLMCQNQKAPNVYILHNHPSGMVTPSINDISFTKWAVTALEMLGVYLIDHIIVADNKLYSFMRDGKLDEFRDKYQMFMQAEEISERL